MNKSYLKISFVSVLLFCAGCTRPSIYSTEYNLDFEYAKNDSMPMQWIFQNSSATGYVLSLDKQVKQHGEASLRARWQKGPTMTVWGGFQNILPGELVAGKELEISGWVKTKDSVNVCAGYGIFPYNPEKYDPDLFGRIDTVGGGRGMSEWTRHTVRQTIDKDVPYVLIAGFVTGKGTAWFDNIELRIDGVRYEDKAIPAPKTELSDREKKELRRYVYPLRTCEPDGGDTQDLDILRQLVGDCKVVGLGENTHGTSEVFKMKDRIIRYLAENCGFDIFALEANMPECYQLNNYTVGGIDNPIRLLIGIYMWPWRTHEMLNMIEWMKAFNASKPRITFTGVDMQNYNGPILQLQTIFEKNPSDKNLVEKIKDKLHRIYPRPFRIDGELAEDIDSDLEELKTRIEAKNRTPMQRAWALQNIDLLHQFLSQKKDPDWRDRGMAENLLWILRNNPGSKAVVWAHNAHINCLKQFNIMQRSMGGFLKKSIGDDYRTFGFVGYEGSYTAWKNGLQSFELPKAHPGTLEYVLGQLDEPLFILDLKKMREEDSSCLQWLGNLEFREVGATPEIFYNTQISDMFDYLIFIRNTSASHMIQ